MAGSIPDRQQLAEVSPAASGGGGSSAPATELATDGGAGAPINVGDAPPPHATRPYVLQSQNPTTGVWNRAPQPWFELNRLSQRGSAVVANGGTHVVPVVLPSEGNNRLYLLSYWVFGMMPALLPGGGGNVTWSLISVARNAIGDLEVVRTTAEVAMSNGFDPASLVTVASPTLLEITIDNPSGFDINLSYTVALSIANEYTP